MKIAASLSLILLSFCVTAQDMQKYLNDTRELVKHGEFKEALKRDIWFHDHALEYNQGMTGVRLSFALSDWKALGEKYPPALVALKQIRDQKTKLVTVNGGPVNLFDDVSSINHELGDDAKTIDLFKTVIKTHPEDAQRCWYFAKKPLFDAKQYAIIHNYIGNPFREFDAIKKTYYRSVSMYPKMSGISLELIKKITEKNLVNQSVQLIQYAVAVNDMKSAKEIQQKAELIVKDDKLVDALKK